MRLICHIESLKILELTTKWFESNLHNQKNNLCMNYLEKRNLNSETINFFRLGYSFNPETSLYSFLKKNSFRVRYSGCSTEKARSLLLMFFTDFSFLKTIATRIKAQTTNTNTM